MTVMLQGPDSTVRIEVLGEELRRLREACGLTLSQVVARIGISESHLSRMESGKRVPRPEDVAALLVVYGVTGEERLELLTFATRANQPGLWQRQGSFEARFTTLKHLESRATKLVSFEPLVIPGLLQTVPYAQAMVREVGMIDDPAQVDERAVGRIHRQSVLRKHDAPRLIALVTESALRNVVGGREVMRDQLRYLAEVAKRPNVTLRVVPTIAGGHPGLNGPFLRLGFDDRQGVVYLGHLTSSLFLEERTEVAVYDRAIATLLSVAISQENSLRLVVEMAASLG
ncbi:helix-turn-helix transcriptional regulator [Actinophytocola sp.]|uniref:helix-turn-helix domain-containing protein n=1 Tax=Actinophytocola sp. TaxID=1872138 RepID=UPI002ED3EF83